jgi:type IV pilus biogenesis protein CpaD/CtpE
MGKYVLVAIAVASLAGCYSNPPSQSAAAGGTAPATTGTHDVRVNFDNGVTSDVPTDYDLRKGDRVIMLSNGKVGPL